MDHEYAVRIMELRTDPHLFPLVREPASRWERAGLTAEQEQRFNLVASLLVGVFVVGWSYSVFFADRGALGVDRAPVAQISSRITRSPLSPAAAPEPVFLVDRFVERMALEFEPYRGESGQVNVVIQEPGDTSLLSDVPADSLPAGAGLELQPVAGTTGQPMPAGQAGTPGIWNVMLRMRDAIRPVSDVSVITTVPLSERRGGKIGRYTIGSWPFERGGAPRPIYETPKGLIQVTPENRNLQVSEHFVLGDFLTKGQENVWPKYVVLSTRLLDKLELTIQELEAAGHPVENVFVVSGFRTPVYNTGGGDPRGRGALSRHMYGDAADITIDNDRNSRMDDLNGDGKVDVKDARIIADAAERAERKYPHLIGGIGIYRPTGAHSGMVHIDTRGFRARW
jgi:uncharacterized protein YcbK (DUF882 family)